MPRAALSALARVEMGQSPPGASVTDSPSGLPLLNGPTEFGLRNPVPRQWSETTLRTAEPGDVLFCVRGSTTGKMNTADRKYAIGRGLAAIRGIDSRDTEYVRYALIHTLPDLLSRITGSTFPNLSRADIVHHVIPTHSPHDRWAIAEVLGALDDKIAANATLARTADELVRADFARAGISSSSTRTLGELAMHPRDLVEPAGISRSVPYVGLEHVPRRLMWLNEHGAASEVSSTKASFREGDTLFGKLRPYFHKVVIAPKPGISSTDILVVRAKNAQLSGFVLAAASSDTTVERCTAASEGTRMPRTSWKDLSSVEVPWPGDAEALSLSARVRAIGDRVASALAESEQLAQTRDALLPGLMSGKIRVRDAERVVEGVV